MGENNEEYLIGVKRGYTPETVVAGINAALRDTSRSGTARVDAYENVVLSATREDAGFFLAHPVDGMDTLAPYKSPASRCSEPEEDRDDGFRAAVRQGRFAL